MKVFFVLLSIIGAVLFGACSNEQNVWEQGTERVTDTSAILDAHLKMAPYLRIVENRYVLDLSENGAMRLGIPIGIYHEAIKDIERVNGTFDEAELEGIPIVIADKTLQEDEKLFSPLIKTRTENPTTYATIWLGYNTSTGSASFTPRSNKVVVSASGTSMVWSVVLKGGISMVLSGSSFGGIVKKTANVSAGYRISVEAQKAAGNGAVVTVAFSNQ